MRYLIYPAFFFIFQFSFGQSGLPLPVLEQKADSLLCREEYANASEVIMSVLDKYGKGMEDTERAVMQYRLANCLVQTGQEILAIPCFRAVLAVKESIIDTGLVCDAMAGLGRSYEYTGRHDSAFYWYMEAYKHVDGSTDTLRIARGSRDMAQLLRVLGRLDKARYYCRMALELVPGIRDIKVIANIYNETAYLFELSKELDSAGYYYQELIDISRQNGYLEGESVGYSNLASVYEQEEKYLQALELKQKGLEIDRESGDVYGMMTSYRAISSTWLLLGRYREALKVLKQAEELCDTSWIMDLSGIEYGYYQAYKGVGSYPDALLHFEEYTRLRQRINEAESKKEVARLLSRYEAEEREQKIKFLEQANLFSENKIRTQRLLIAFMSFVGLVLAMFTWWWIRDKNQSLKRMKTELHHFLLSQERASVSSFGSGTEEEEHTDLQPVLEPATVHEPSRAYLQWGLTPRESEILFYLGQGCTNAHIAARLFISENTVKFHIKNIYLKLDVKNRIQALLRCNENNHH